MKKLAGEELQSSPTSPDSPSPPSQVCIAVGAEDPTLCLITTNKNVSEVELILTPASPCEVSVPKPVANSVETCPWSPTAGAALGDPHHSVEPTTLL